MFLTKQYSAFNPKRYFLRELGFPDRLGSSDVFAKSLYKCLKPCAEWYPFEDTGTQLHGGVFNMEFSPEGTMMVAACERRCILMFDPLTHKKIHEVPDAHSDCVNCVKFLDSRMFATCSDDTTIALWDVRNLRKKIRALHGHSSWIKNIEYSVKDNLLVTSGLDGSIYTWDINSYTERSLVYQRVFHMPDLMRCRISPDASKLVMSTTRGLIIVIHDLDLSTLAQNLHGFKPNIYRLMQCTLQNFPIAMEFNHLFDKNRKSNRIQFISDFPKENDAQIVSSLQVHPQGWCVLSRNVNDRDTAEWTCVHDIQSYDDECLTKMNSESSNKNMEIDIEEETEIAPPRRSNRLLRSAGRAAETSSTSSSSSSTNSNSRASGSRGSRPARESAPEEEPPVEEPQVEVRVLQQNTPIRNDIWEASITIKQHRIAMDTNGRGDLGRNYHMQRIMGITTGIEPPPRDVRPEQADAPVARQALRTIAASHSGTPLRSRASPGKSKSPKKALPTIKQNEPRLLYYAKEPNLGKGFIKELSFSTDGRLVCSPYGNGMRLLAFNDQCSELSNCIPEFNHPQKLVEVQESIRHLDLVVSSKFSPLHCSLVTGCLAGRIVWYQPLG